MLLVNRKHDLDEIKSLNEKVDELNLIISNSKSCSEEIQIQHENEIQGIRDEMEDLKNLNLTT